MRVLVTGGSGIVGHYVIDELLKGGFSVVNVDTKRPGSLDHSGNIGVNASAKAAVNLRSSWSTEPQFVEINISDYGNVISAMSGCDAVVALASRPTPFGYRAEDIFATNSLAVWNTCQAAEHLGIDRIVVASSYNALGAFATASAQGWNRKQVKPPKYFPLDPFSETLAEDPYSVSKWIGEQVADSFARRKPRLSIASLRLTGVWDQSKIKLLKKKPVRDPWERCQGFWTYVDIRDVARAFVMAVSCEPWHGHERMFVNATDTILDIPTSEALKEVYPDVPIRSNLGTYEAVVSISNTTKLTGWSPRHSWRDG